VKYLLTPQSKTQAVSLESKSNMTSSIKGIKTEVLLAQYPVDWVSLNIWLIRTQMIYCACLCMSNRQESGEFTTTNMQLFRFRCDK